jgi:hypothetical protein
MTYTPITEIQIGDVLVTDATVIAVEVDEERGWGTVTYQTSGGVVRDIDGPLSTKFEVA